MKFSSHHRNLHLLLGHWKQVVNKVNIQVYTISTYLKPHILTWQRYNLILYHFCAFYTHNFCILDIASYGLKTFFCYPFALSPLALYLNNIFPLGYISEINIKELMMKWCTKLMHAMMFNAKCMILSHTMFLLLFVNNIEVRA